MPYYIQNCTEGAQQVFFLLSMAEDGSFYEFTNRLEVAWPFGNYESAKRRMLSVNMALPKVQTQILTGREAKALVRAHKKAANEPAC